MRHSSPALRRRRARAQHGLTMVETTLLISLVAIIFAVAIPTFARVMRGNKIAEAASQLERLHELAAAYYTTPQPTERGPRLRCLPPAAGPAPEIPSTDPVEIDFGAETTPGHETWQALGFQPQRPLRFRYSFVPRASGCGLFDRDDDPDVPFLLLRAEGDLDGDGEYSVFERTARPNQEGELIPYGALTVRNRIE